MSAAVNKDIHVVVLMGGWSSEREVSLTSGRMRVAPAAIPLRSSSP